MTQDQDIEFMDRAQLKQEVRSLRAQRRRIEAAMQEWLDKQGHDRCWWFPELFARLCAALGLTPSKEPRLPPEAEFEQGCTRFRKEEYVKAGLLPAVPPVEADEGGDVGAD